MKARGNRLEVRPVRKPCRGVDAHTARMSQLRKSSRTASHSNSHKFNTFAESCEDGDLRRVNHGAEDS